MDFKLLENVVAKKFSGVRADTVVQLDQNCGAVALVKGTKVSLYDAMSIRDVYSKAENKHIGKGDTVDVYVYRQSISGLSAGFGDLILADPYGVRYQVNGSWRYSVDITNGSLLIPLIEAKTNKELPLYNSRPWDPNAALGFSEELRGEVVKVLKNLIQQNANRISRDPEYFKTNEFFNAVKSVFYCEGSQTERGIIMSDFLPNMPNSPTFTRVQC